VCEGMIVLHETKQKHVALLLQRGREMLRVCQYNMSSAVFYYTYFRFRFTTAYN